MIKKGVNFLISFLLILYSMSAISKQTDLKPLTAALKENPNVDIVTFLPTPFMFHVEYGTGTKDSTTGFIDVAMPIAINKPDLAFYTASVLRLGSWDGRFYSSFYENQKLYRKQVKLFKIALNSTNEYIRRLSARFLGNIYYYGMLRPNDSILSVYKETHDVDIDYSLAEKYYLLCGNDCNENYISSALRTDANKGIKLLKNLRGFKKFTKEYSKDWWSDYSVNQEAEFKYHYLWSIYKFGLYGITKDKNKEKKYFLTLLNSPINNLKDIIQLKTGEDYYQLSLFFQRKDSLSSDKTISESFPKDKKVELFLLEGALSKKNGKAAYELHSKYLNGNGVRKDILKSYAYVNLALEFTDDSERSKKNMKISLNQLEEKLTEGQIIYAQQLSNEIMSDLLVKYKKQPISGKSSKSSGTGFFVSKDGYIVTNEHVVNKCSSITIKQNKKDIPASLIVSDVRNDVALLKAGETNSMAYIRGGRGVRQGDSIIAYGYPLSNILSSSAKVTTGMVNSLSGLGDDFRYMQISAPVQPGNSGGPLIDTSGNVVGVVSSKLNAAEIQKTTGDIPQNINFALKSSVIKDLLDANEINYETRPFLQDFSVADIIEDASKYTVQIHCIY